jgi:hypothetical protein
MWRSDGYSEREYTHRVRHSGVHVDMSCSKAKNDVRSVARLSLTRDLPGMIRRDRSNRRKRACYQAVPQACSVILIPTIATRFPFARTIELAFQLEAGAAILYTLTPMKLNPTFPPVRLMLYCLAAA